MVEPEELSSDLEYLLRSGEASSLIMAEALVDKYFAAVHRLSLSILDDGEAAGYVAVRVFIKAVLNLYTYEKGHYPGEEGVKLWLYEIALRECRSGWKRLKARRILRASLPIPGPASDFGSSLPGNEMDAALWLALDSLDYKNRLALLLQILDGCQISQIARLLHTRESDVRTYLRAARLKILESLRQAAVMKGDLEEEEFEERLARSLEVRFPVKDLAAPERELIEAEIGGEILRQGARRSSLVSLKEISLVSAAILIVTGLIWGGNRLMPEPQVTPLPLPANRTSQPPAQNPGLAPSPTIPRARNQRARMFYYPSPGETLEELAARFELPLQELREINALEEGENIEPGLPVEITLGQLPEIGLEATSQKPAALPKPLDERSSPGELRQRIARSSSYWRTLWANARFYDYGPGGYVGPPRFQRAQLWISQPDLSFEISGERLEGPDYGFLTRAGLDFVLYDRPGFAGMAWHSKGLVGLSPIRDLIFPGESAWFNTQAVWEILDRINVAGRAALVVDWTRAAGEQAGLPFQKARLWVDAITGVILRQQQFDRYDTGTLVFEALISGIRYDLDFPDPAIFDPTSPLPERYFVDDAGYSLPVTIRARSFMRPPASGHKPLLHRLPPVDFNPSSQPLTFQYPLGSNFQMEATISAGLFAGDYYLGELPMGNPWVSRCDRSPDGRLVAIFTPVQRSQNFWFDLSNPGERRPIHRNMDVFEFAFSPDSRRLAFQGYPHSTGESGIYILDTETSDLRQLREMMSASSLVWSPDGLYLALLGSTGPGFASEAMILDAASGEITYRTTIDPIQNLLGTNDSQDWPARGWPAHAWEVEFPKKPGLGSCTAPPEVGASPAGQ